ncbi:MAG: 50S ribosomal protein L11 methyltransferase [Verrucomicrobiota bacterium]|nr:50S ribosomal protein L11 methyltransferase [Verrucomicrobiota bacterium]
MLKIKVKLHKKFLLEAENILFEIAPSNWMLFSNRKTKDLVLEGIFANKKEADHEIMKFQKEFSGNLDDASISEIDKSWQNAYKFHFKPWKYKGFTFMPEWERSSSINNGDDINIFIDPGMAFGTGTHETTRLCAESLIDNYGKKSSSICDYNFLDIGCGSGILSILAHYLGFNQIHGIDNDENAIQNSLYNSSLNFNCSDIKFEKLCLHSMRKSTYNCIVANIQSDVLIKNASKLICLLKSNGILILSGILNYEAEDVSKAFNKVLDSFNFASKQNLSAKNEWCAIFYELI